MIVRKWKLQKDNAVMDKELKDLRSFDQEYPVSWMIVHVRWLIQALQRDYDNCKLRSDWNANNFIDRLYGLAFLQNWLTDDYPHSDPYSM